MTNERVEAEHADKNRQIKRNTEGSASVKDRHNCDNDGELHGNGPNLLNDNKGEDSKTQRYCLDHDQSFQSRGVRGKTGLPGSSRCLKLEQ